MKEEGQNSMQNRYVGDIGDFVKLAILRALAPDRRLGVAWWLYPDEVHNNNGRHIGYLQCPEKWRAFDPELFDGLERIVAAGDRRVSVLERAELLPGTVFSSEVIPTGSTPALRRAERAAWFLRVQERMRDRDFVFLDPDNGLETADYNLGQVKAGKSVSLANLRSLAAPARALIVYHHHTRRKGGHLAELEFWADRLRSEGFASVDVIRSRPYSPRAFFLLNASPEMRARAERLTLLWKGLLSWHPGA